MALLLSETDVKALLTMDDLIETMGLALADFSARAVTQPVRTVLEVGDQKAFYGLMPAWMPSRPALGTKLVTVFESNAAVSPARSLASRAAFSAASRRRSASSRDRKSVV